MGCKYGLCFPGEHGQRSEFSSARLNLSDRPHIFMSCEGSTRAWACAEPTCLPQGYSALLLTYLPSMDLLFGCSHQC